MEHQDDHHMGALAGAAVAFRNKFGQLSLETSHHLFPVVTLVNGAA